MSWSVTLSGNKDEAKKLATEQSDKNIGYGYQTEAQKAAVLAVIDALPGTHVAGYIGGHNNDGGCTMNANVNSHTEVEAPAA